MLLTGLMVSKPGLIIVWVLQAIGYFFVLKKMGLKRWACVIPFLAERELSKVLFRRLRTFYRPFVVAAVLMIFGLYLREETLGGVYIAFASVIYGIFLIRLYWRLRKGFGRGFIYAVLLILFPPLFLFLLGVGRRTFQPLPMKPVKDYGRMGNFLRRAALVLISAVEIAVLVFGVGVLAVRALPPEIMVRYQTGDFYDKTKDLQGDGKVVTREDALGDAAGSVADMTPSRQQFFPDHSGDRNVVVLAYVVGSNLEHKGGLASANIRQMIDATKAGENLTFVVEAGGSKRWFTKGIEKASCGRYEIADGKLTKVEDLPDDLCMSEGKSLEDFLTWAKKKYAADRHMLVLWDHGGGVPYGYGSDDLNKRSEDKGSTMQTSEVVNAIAASGMKFDLIGFDACLMQDIEIAAALEPYADYYLASEEIEGGYGWFYTSPFGKLAKDPGMPTTEFAEDLLSCYDQMNTIVKDEGGKPDTKATLSLVDTTLAKPAYRKLAGLFGDMDDAIRESPDAYASVAAAGTNAYAFEDNLQIDLVDYLSILQKADGDNDISSDEGYEDVIHSVQASVLCRNSDSAEGINGMAFAFPYKSIGVYGDTGRQLKALKLKTERRTFNDIFSIMAVQKKKAMEDESYMDNMPGSSEDEDDSLLTMFDELVPTDYTEEDWYVKGFEDYDTRKALVDIPLKETPEGYEIQLPEKTWKIIADSQIMVYRNADDGKKGQQTYLGRDHIGGTDAAGHPTVDMDDSWVHIGGELVCYEADAPRETKAGTVYSGRVPARLNDEEDILLNIEWDPVKDEESGEAVKGHVTGYQTTESGLLSDFLDTKGTLTLEGGDTIQFIFETYDGEGNLVKRAPAGGKVRVRKQSRLAVEDLPLEAGHITFGGVLTDIYQRTMTTEMVEVDLN